MFDIAAANSKKITKKYEISQSKILLDEILTSLIQTRTKVRIDGDNELEYLISMAIESSREKIILKTYENS
jgi:hypothetical protein